MGYDASPATAVDAGTLSDFPQVFSIGANPNKYNIASGMAVDAVFGAGGVSNALNMSNNLVSALFNFVSSLQVAVSGYKNLLLLGCG